LYVFWCISLYFILMVASADERQAILRIKVPAWVTWREIKDTFSTYGEVVNVDGPQDGPSGRQAHVRMRDVDGASAIMRELSRNGGCLSFEMSEKWMWRRSSASRKVAVAVVRLSGDDEETYFMIFPRLPEDATGPRCFLSRTSVKLLSLAFG
jgi:hypothetical protein